MANTLDSCGTSIAQSDASGECGSDEREEYVKDGKEEYKSHDELNQYTCVHSLSPVRGIPPELWWNILEMTDDPRALLAAGCTCRTLRDIVREIIKKRTDMSGLDDLLSDPTGGYFFSRASIRSAELPPWISRYDTKSGRLREMTIVGGTLLLRSQARSALSKLNSVTTLRLTDTHFLSFSDFARTVCAVPNVDTFVLYHVTMNDSRSYSLEGIYFARDLRLKKLYIANCAFGESHPIWNLLTAPSLSDSFEHIVAQTTDSDLELALQQLYIPPAALGTARLGRLKRLQFGLWDLPCEAVCDIVLGLFSHNPANRVTAIEINYRCSHSPPCRSTWGTLFTTLVDGITVADFAALKTISVYLETKYPFNFDNIHIVVDSLPYSTDWTERFTMSSMTFTDEGSADILPFSWGILEQTEADVEPCPRGVALSIQFGIVGLDQYRAAIVYTRRSDAVAPYASSDI
ncbi:hypothetical protein CERSUDRAFT_125417 [Gelatoporia subvermispora B]|uniref:F-box domain-containing protein n=1 Tax=Ceriporiopsis subvermispora (strain B) TaxID=914234 RepID=M2QB28_CERS8|nr:hypothetical protein CERSUDRAFT_125417 [Gelatoporia subvermispora B]